MGSISSTGRGTFEGNICRPDYNVLTHECIENFRLLPNVVDE